MHPTDKLKTIDLDSPNIQAELTEAFPEHDVVVIAGCGTPLAYIIHDNLESADGIIGENARNPLFDHAEFLLDMIACEAYTDVPELSEATTLPEGLDPAHVVYRPLNELPAHTRREKPPDG